jgi:hypothetical protein
MANALLEKETLTSKDVDEIMRDGQESKPEEPVPQKKDSETS